MITTQLTPDLPDNGVKHVTVGNARGAHLQEQTAHVFHVLEQIRGNLSSHINPAESLYDMKINRKTNQEDYITGGTS